MPLHMQTLWNHLVVATEHYFRDGFSLQARINAANNMMRYAKLLEEHAYPDNLFTANLHWMVCR